MPNLCVRTREAYGPLNTRSAGDIKFLFPLLCLLNIWVELVFESKADMIS